MMKSNDTVICIDNSDREEILTLNKEYRVLKASNHYVRVMCDSGYEVSFYIDRFSLAEKLNLPDWF